MELPSFAEARAELGKLLRAKAYLPGPVVLSSGKESRYYFDTRRVVLSSQGAFLAARVLWEKIKILPVNTVGGPALGADPLLGALAVLSYFEGLHYDFFIVRKESKKHGTRKQIEGSLLKSSSSKVLLIDDVLTTGTSLLGAVKAVQNEGAKILKAIVLIDREEGGKENLAQEGIPLETIFTMGELLSS